jgi:acetate kinase
MRGKRILVFNVGSSSIKYSFFEDSNLISSGNYEELKTQQDYEISVKKIFKELNDKKIDFIIHRVVHGGELKKPHKINEGVKKNIKKFSQFAPLHNQKQLIVIELCEKYKKPQYAVFDTLFFSEMPEVAKIYAIPRIITKKYNIKRYGFHGLSHKSVSKGLKGKTITCHLGAGVSISAILNGKPLDTSMGFTTAEGPMMGTRSGTIDPGIIFFLGKEKYNVEKLLTQDSGLKGISGYSDFRQIRARMKKDKECKLAYDLFAYQIIKIIGSYITVLNGLDNLVFTARIGENVAGLREKICNHLSFLGVKLDSKKNKLNSELISSKESKIKVWVRKPDEEKVAIEEVLKIFKN